MLQLYGNLANWLFRFHWVLLLLAAGSGCMFVFSLFSSVGTNDQALVSLCSLLWAMSLIIFVQVFVKPLPELDGTGGFFERLKVKLTRGMRRLMAVVVTVLFGAVLYVSLKAIGILV